MTVSVKLAELRNENMQLRKDIEEIKHGYQETTRLLKNPRFGELLKKYM
jgi:hypothetical protein